MWIRMISTAAGPRLPHCLQSGSVYQVEDELGSELVAGRAATEVADPRPKKAEASEVAAVDDGEKAIDPAGEKKSKSLIEQLTKSSAEADAGKTNDADASNDATDADDAAKKKSAKASAKKS